MWLTCRQVKTVKLLQRMGEGVRWPVESYGPGFTSESMGGAGTARGPLAPSQGLLLHQVLTWSSALLSQGHPAGAARGHFPLTSCVFSLVPSDPPSFYSHPYSPELGCQALAASSPSIYLLLTSPGQRKREAGGRQASFWTH